MLVAIPVDYRAVRLLSLRRRHTFRRCDVEAHLSNHLSQLKALISSYRFFSNLKVVQENKTDV